MCLRLTILLIYSGCDDVRIWVTIVTKLWSQNSDLCHEFTFLGSTYKLDMDRNLMAIDRTVLANQRTIIGLMYERAFISSVLGLTIIGIESFEDLKFLAVPSFVISFVVLIFGLYSYFQQKKRIQSITNRSE